MLDGEKMYGCMYVHALRRRYCLMPLIGDGDGDGDGDVMEKERIEKN